MSELMKFDPATGIARPYPSEAGQYREYHGKVAWLFNPFTGERRDARDVGSDCYGHAITLRDGEIKMTDRELIELAARAACYKVIHSFENNDSLMIEVSERKYEVFNPLTSDADAFRLAVKLGIDVHTGDTFGKGGGGFTTADCLKHGMIISMQLAHGGDPYAATRRAITRAAAEIGRGMV